jgi:Flp pilus assembly protein TadG
MNSLHRHTPKANDRRGAVVVLAAFFMIVMVAFIAMAVDLGYLQNARTELQRSADSAAMAGAWELVADGAPGLSDDTAAARTAAAAFAGYNPVCSSAPAMDLNSANSHSGDIVVGYIADISDPNATLDTSDPTKFNAVQVRVRRTTASNGEVPMFFGRMLGLGSIGAEATAVSVLASNHGGFRAPSDGDTIGILPFALDKTTWENLVNNGVGTDNWSWDADCEELEAGSDGVKEVNLFPQGTGSPGNRGTVDIGGNNNSTADLARQITSGISEQDFVDLGKPLEFDDDGKLYLNGDTGISAGVKDELASIIGQTRIIPIFESVCGPGNNAEYTIVQWAGVRVLDVKLTGSQSQKRLMIQPASVITRFGIPTEAANSSWYVYSPARLTR